MKKINNLFRIFLFVSLIAALLIFPKQSLLYAFKGLTLWFEKMIPVLLPFMIISGIMINLGIHTSFIKIFTPILKPIFQLKGDCLYTIFMGFLCGFPMGAKTSVQLYKRNKITKLEAEYLLAFCNNIGPVYFLGFVLPLTGVSKIAPYLFGMYGIPFLYGIFLRHTYFRTKLNCPVQQKNSDTAEIDSFYSLFSTMDDVIMSSLRQIAMLGGYMVLFNVLNILPYLWGIKESVFSGILYCLLEITGGIVSLLAIPSISSKLLFILFTLLIFGGFSCMAQTFSILKETDLSIRNYIGHKLILTLLCAVYYFFFFFL